jgi:hypothetical protein
MSEEPKNSIQAGDSHSFRQSAANRSWLGILFFVLAVLFFETWGAQKPVDNVIVNGDDEALGAQVFVDNKLIGTLAGADDQKNKTGLNGSVLLTRLKPGSHLLEVKKDKYKTFSKPIDVRLEEYIGVDLVKANE